MPELIFQEEGHVYIYDGVIRPSLTQILRAVRVRRDDGSEGAFFNYDFLSESKSDDVMARGTWVADAVAALIQYGQPSFPSSILEQLEAEAPRWFPFFLPFTRWLPRAMASGFAPLLVEKPLYSRRHGFAGRPDLVCILNGRRPSIVEIKTGSALPETAIQTAGQAVLLEDQEDYPHRQEAHDRYALELPARGEAQLIPHRNHAQDRSLFLATLTLYRHHCPNGATNGK